MTNSHDKHPPQPAIAVCIFEQTNEHLRNTEQKQLAVSAAFIGLVAVTASIVATQAQDPAAPGALIVAIYSLLFATGIVVFALQLWYRRWKEHYIAVCQEIVSSWEVCDTMAPSWMFSPHQETQVKRFRLHIDNSIIYLTGLLNTCVFGFIIRSFPSLLPLLVAGAVAGILAIGYAVLVVLLTRVYWGKTGGRWLETGA